MKDYDQEFDGIAGELIKRAKGVYFALRLIGILLFIGSFGSIIGGLINFAEHNPDAGVSLIFWGIVYFFIGLLCNKISDYLRHKSTMDASQYQAICQIQERLKTGKITMNKKPPYPGAPEPKA